MMKIARLMWVGHVIRISDSEMSKRIMNYNPEGNIRAGRPKATRIDAVGSNMRKVGVMRWIEMDGGES
jgi:hypothetical protein